MTSIRPGALYKRLAGDRFVRGLSGLKGRRVVKARSLLPRRFQPTVRLRRRDVIIRVGSDPLDAEITDMVMNRHRHVYFPTSVGDPVKVTLVLEVGAHHGIYTVAAASEYPNARIIACEPSLDAVEVVRRQIRDNQLEDRVLVVPAAIADRDGLAVLSHEPSGSWGATLFKPETITGSEHVVTLTLANVLHGEIPDVVKSNAEGAEFTLVPQLAHLEPKPEMLVLAVHPDYGDDVQLRDDLAAIGYEVSVAIEGDHPVWHCVLGADQTRSRGPLTSNS